MPSNGKLMSIREVARQLGVRFYTARRWIEAGDIRSIRVGAYLRVSPEALADFRAGTVRRSA